MTRAARVEDYTDPVLDTYTPVPRAGEGVCRICHNAPNPGYSTCLSCDRATGAVSHPVRLVVPISLYRVNTQLHAVLRDYKDSPSAQTRERFGVQVAAMLWRFLRDHRACIVAEAGCDFDVVTVVPSTRSRRAGAHPMDGVLAMITALRAEVLLGPGATPLGHNQASDTGYEALPAARGRRVLLVDDTYTSGARLQSAASALQLAGAHVAAGLVIGRVINPTFNESSRRLWDQQAAIPFDFATCCLE